MQQFKVKAYTSFKSYTLHVMTMTLCQYEQACATSDDPSA